MKLEGAVWSYLSRITLKLFPCHTHSFTLKSNRENHFASQSYKDTVSAFVVIPLVPNSEFDYCPFAISGASLSLRTVRVTLSCIEMICHTFHWLSGYIQNMCLFCQEWGKNPTSKQQMVRYRSVRWATLSRRSRNRWLKIIYWVIFFSLFKFDQPEQISSVNIPGM